MSGIIRDPSTGIGAKVTENGRLQNFSITENRIADISDRKEESFIIASDFMSITTTVSFSALMYIKNESEKKFRVQSLRTCQTFTGFAQFYLYKGVSSGTIVTNKVSAIISPMNVGSSNTFDGIAYSGVDGDDFTDGEKLTQYTNKSPGHSTQPYNGALILPRGSSLGILCKPSAAGDICIELQGWFE